MNNSSHQFLEFTLGCIGLVIVVILGVLFYALVNIPGVEESATFIAQIVPYLCIGIPIVSVILISTKVFLDHLHRSSRMEGGSYPLRIYKKGDRVYVLDPNQMHGPYGIFNLKTGEWGPEVSAEDQRLVTLSVNKTRTVHALGEGFRYTAVGKWLSGAWDQTQEGGAEVVDNVKGLLGMEAIQLLSLKEAWDRSTDMQWILGQNHITGDVYPFDFDENHHLGILGATGTGKTGYIGYLLSLYALRFGWHVVVLDPKGSKPPKGWQPMTRYGLEYHFVKWEEYGEYLKLIDELSKHRTSEGIYKPKLLFILEEIGSISDQMRIGSQGLWTRTFTLLGDLFRLSREAEIHFVLMDQDPTKIPATIIANLPVNLCFSMGGSKGATVHEYNLETLDRKGQFQVKGERYNAWPTWEALQTLPLDSFSAVPILDLEGSSKRNLNPPMGDPLRIPPPVGPSDDQTPLDGTLTPGAPLLKGRPSTKEEKELVWKTWKESGENQTTTCRILWGKRTPSKLEYLKAVLRERGVTLK